MAEPGEASATEALAGAGADAVSSVAPREKLEVENGGSPATADASAAVEETLAAGGEGLRMSVRSPVGAEDEGSGAGGEEATDGDGGDPAAGDEQGEESEEPEDTLTRADELFEKGSKAIEVLDFVEAVDCLSRALEIRVGHYGELAPECAGSYYKYGCALLYKAQEEADPLGNVPSNSSRNSAANATVSSVENSSSAMTSVSEVKQDQNPGIKEEEEKDGARQNDDDDGGGGEGGDGEDLTEADEDDSDLDLAWKMLDIARAIVEKSPEDSMEKVNILSALGEVAVEREDIETSLGDYKKALSMLENLVESDHRRTIELNFRLCLVLELGSKTEDAVSYCKKAIMLCESRLQKLKECATDMKTEVTTDSVGSSSTTTDHSSNSEKQKEIELIGGILGDLEKKLEDLQQLVTNPTSLFEEMMKMIASKSSGGENNNSVSSSRLAFMNGASDSPTSNTAATDGTVTHLGVVGRGVKRASIAPIPMEPPSKKPPVDGSADKTDTTSSEVLDLKTGEP